MIPYNRRILRHLPILWVIMGLIIIFCQILLAFLFLTGFYIWIPNLFAVETKLPAVNFSMQKYGYVGIAYEDCYTLDVIAGRYSSDQSSPDEESLVVFCNVTDRESLSAIYRARSSYCKQLLLNTTCHMKRNKLYPSWLPHQCPSKGFTYGRHLGCYADNKMDRILSNSRYNFSMTNSKVFCLDACIKGGYSYAGVEFGEECYCGNDMPHTESMIDSARCNYKCPGNVRETCGGYLSLNIYETGISTSLLTENSNTSTGKLETEQRNVRIAFLLTLNGRSIRQVLRLINAIYHVDHFIFIHVDSKQEYLYRELLPLESRFSNVRLSRNRHNSIWGGASLLTVLLQSMSELTRSNWQWDFIINLSETDFPIKTNKELVSFLSANRGKNFVKSHGRDVHHFIRKQGLDKTFIECEGRMWRIGKRTLPSGIVIDGGSDWVALSRPFVQFIADEKENNSLIRGLLVFYEHTLLPAESFFHTVLRNSIFCATYVNNNLRVTNWKRHLGCRCQYKRVVDWCGCSPNAFTMDDWPKIAATVKKPVFFARKFDPLVNNAVIDRMEDWLYPNRTGNGYTFSITQRSSYWNNILHWKDYYAEDDAMLTICTSLARISFLSNNKVDKNGVMKLIQAHTYHKNDEFQGVLVEYKVDSGNHEYNVESFFEPLVSAFVLEKSKWHDLVSRISFVKVGTNFDVKEQMSRNFISSIGPMDEIHFMYKFLPGTHAFNISILWTDPIKDVADISRIQINESVSVGYLKANIPSPLMPGIWKALLICDERVIYNIYFLVTPLQFSSGVPITCERNRRLNQISKRYYNLSSNEYDQLLAISKNDYRVEDSFSELGITDEGNDSNCFNYDNHFLVRWIDNLVRRFYKKSDSCQISSDDKDAMRKYRNLKLCHYLEWSSHLKFPEKKRI